MEMMGRDTEVSKLLNTPKLPQDCQGFWRTRVIHLDKNGAAGRETEKRKGQDTYPAEIGRGKMTLGFP